MFTSNSLFPKHSFTILSDLELLSKVKKILITRSSQSVIVNNSRLGWTPSACGQTLFAFYSLLLLKHKNFTGLWALCPFESFYNIWPPKVHQNFPTLHLDTQRVVGISQQVRLYEKKTQNALCWQGQIMQLFKYFFDTKNYSTNV